MPRFFVDAKGIPNTYVNCLTCYNEPANIPENGGIFRPLFVDAFRNPACRHEDYLKAWVLKKNTLYKNQMHEVWIGVVYIYIYIWGCQNPATLGK